MPDASLYVWQEQKDGRWGVIAAAIPHVGWGLLQSRSFIVARDHLRPLAEAHARSSARPVRLARFMFSEVIETYPPTPNKEEAA